MGAGGEIPDPVRGALPRGVRLNHVRRDGSVAAVDRDDCRPPGPGGGTIPFIDDGRFAHCLVGDAATAPERPHAITAAEAECRALGGEPPGPRGGALATEATTAFRALQVPLRSAEERQNVHGVAPATVRERLAGRLRRVAPRLEARR